MLKTQIEERTAYITLKLNNEKFDFLCTYSVGLYDHREQYYIYKLEYVDCGYEGIIFYERNHDEFNGAIAPLALNIIEQIKCHEHQCQQILKIFNKDT